MFSYLFSTTLVPQIPNSTQQLLPFQEHCERISVAIRESKEEQRQKQLFSLFSYISVEIQ